MIGDPYTQVQVSVSGLKEETDYHIYCFAEDDETDGTGLSWALQVISGHQA